MSTRRVIFLFLLNCVLHEVRLRSLDQVIEDVDIEYSERNDSDIISKFPSRVWYDYEMAGRTEELVKVQLDLVMTKDHWDMVIDTDEALPSREKRNAVKTKMRLWPRRIPYVINDGFDDNEDKLKLVLAMDHWEEHTCLEFVEAKSTDSDYIEFVPDPSKCESLLGKMQGRQVINLAPPCMHKEIIVHEIGHALGLYHEHMRADRDKHVTVHYENIKEGFHRQFDKLKPEHYNDYNKPYDYESIMHYGKLYYSKNRIGNLLTIKPHKASYLNVTGNALSLSFYDVQIVNDMYECSRGCEPKVCLENGFLGKNCDCYCAGETSYDIVVCGETGNCGTPNISLSDYSVYTNDNYDEEIKGWDENVTYAHGTKLPVVHRNISCGLREEIFNCTDGQWEGEVPPCETACMVDEFDDSYLVQKESQERAKPGDEVASHERIYVTCRNRRREHDMDIDIFCIDGDWTSRISDIECKGRALCPMVLDGQIDGTLEDGFTITCSPGYELVTKGGPGNKFTCSWEGFWEPAAPVCKPANCTIPARNFAKFFRKNNDEMMSGSDVIHGSDVTLRCDRRYIPVKEIIPCKYGQWMTANGRFPNCDLASCDIPVVGNGKLLDKDGEEIKYSEVMHGSDVTLKCDKGHTPDEELVPCRHRKWQTSDETFPKCTLVECQAPTVVKIRGYRPKKEKYMFGDIVRVGFCQGNLALEGSRHLKCLKTGEWSDSAICQRFCNHGEDFKQLKNTAFKKGERYRNFGIASYTGCKRTCKNYKRFLCLSFVYGFANLKHHCRLYRWSAEREPGKVEKRSFWTTGVRTCARKKP